MKKNHSIQKFAIKTLAFLFINVISLSLFAQTWTIYDGSTLPNEDGFGIKDNAPGPNMIAEIIPDPDDASNNIFHYEQLDNADSARTTYRITDITATSSFTVVFRVSGVPGVESDNIFQMDVRGTEYRSKVTLSSFDTLSFFAPDDIKTKQVSLKDWHVYRFTMEGQMFKLFMDENSDPILSGISESESSDNYFKFGDGTKTFSYAFYLDWIIWDGTGAYEPGDSPVPPTLSTEHADVVSVNAPKLSDEVTIYPVPASNMVTLSLPAEFQNSTYTIYDITGAEVFSDVTNELNETIDISSLQQGIYMMHILKDNQSVSKQFVVE